MSAWFWHTEHAATRNLPGIPPIWRHICHCLPMQQLYSAFCSLFFGLHTTGAENVPKDTPCIFVCNHGSHYDGFLLYAALRRTDTRAFIPVIWHRMLEYPIVGPVLKSVRAIPIEHDAGEVGSRMDAMRIMLKHIAEKRHLFVFPEGHRSDVLDVFHPGAALIALHCQVPLVPVTLRGVQPLFKELDRMPRIWGRVEVVIHPPIYPREPEDRGPEDGASGLTARARACVASALDYPVGPAIAGRVASTES